MDIVMDITASTRNPSPTTVRESNHIIVISRDWFPIFPAIAIAALIWIHTVAQSKTTPHPTILGSILLILSVAAIISISFSTTRNVEIDIERDLIKLYYRFFNKYNTTTRSICISNIKDMNLIVLPIYMSDPTFSSRLRTKKGGWIELLPGVRDEGPNRQLLDLIHQKTGIGMVVVTKPMSYPE